MSDHNPSLEAQLRTSLKAYDTFDQHVQQQIYPYITQLQQEINELKEVNRRLLGDNARIKKERDELAKEYTHQEGLPATDKEDYVVERALRKFSRSIQSLISQSHDTQDALLPQMAQLVDVQKKTKTAVEVLAKQQEMVAFTVKDAACKQEVCRSAVEVALSAIVERLNDAAQTAPSDICAEVLEASGSASTSLETELLRAENGMLKQLLRRHQGVFRSIAAELAGTSSTSSIVNGHKA